MVEHDEAKLLELARAGDRRAFSALVRLHDRKILGCALSMLKNRDEAEDAVQETFLRAYRAIGRFDGRAELSTWLYRICVNVCLNHLRKRKRHTATDVDDVRGPEVAADPSQGQNDPARAVEMRQIEGRVADALDALSPSLRTTVVLVLLQGLPHKEAAEILGVPEGTIAWRIHEARRRLRVHLAEVAPAAAAGSGGAS